MEMKKLSKCCFFLANNPLLCLPCRVKQLFHVMTLPSFPPLCCPPPFLPPLFDFCCGFVANHLLVGSNAENNSFILSGLPVDVQKKLERFQMCESCGRKYFGEPIKLMEERWRRNRVVFEEVLCWKCSRKQH